jgi:ubiquinone/menaquinone biosynthesis C-methylase UbiE
MSAAPDHGLSATDVAQLTELYNGRFGQFGHDVKAVGWGSTESQQLRFAILCRGVSLAGARVLDVGCGLGDFVPWAESRFGADFDYVGLDLSGDLVQAARARFGTPRRSFLEGTLHSALEIGRFDVVVMSGTLTFRTSDNEGTMRAMLAQAFARCDGVVSANFLSCYVDYQLPKNHHFAPEQVFAYARTLTPYVTLYHDYPLHEFSVQLHRHPTS